MLWQGALSNGKRRVIFAKLAHSPNVFALFLSGNRCSGRSELWRPKRNSHRLMLLSSPGEEAEEGISKWNQREFFLTDQKKKNPSSSSLDKKAHFFISFVTLYSSSFYFQYIKCLAHAVLLHTNSSMIRN